MEIAFVIFYTDDIQRIAAFYKDVVELEVDYIEDNSFASFIIGSSRLGIKKQVKDREIPGHQTIIIRVNDIENLYQKYKNDKQVNWYKDLTVLDWGTVFGFLDPDGNKVEFVED